MNVLSAISHFEWLVVFITLVGGFYTMDARIDAANNRFDQFMIAWHEEAKDFHGRLERIDCEFKLRIYQIEKNQDNRQKIKSEE